MSTTPKKLTWLSVGLRPAELRAIKALAKKEGTSMARIFRNAVAKAYKIDFDDRVPWSQR